MEIGSGRKVSGITFSRTEIVKAVIKKRPPSKFWRVNQSGNSENSNGVFSQAPRKPCRKDIKLTGSVLKSR